jgi:hypothetical protein
MTLSLVLPPSFNTDVTVVVTNNITGYDATLNNISHRQKKRSIKDVVSDSNKAAQKSSLDEIK